jgi:sugar diacid utilization regulator
MGIYGQLLQVALEGAADLTLPGALLDLKRADKKGVLLDTAEVFLDAAGDTALAAEQLHIHRSTLHYRLSKIQEASGLNMSTGKDRLTLHLGLKLLRLMGGVNFELPVK